MTSMNTKTQKFMTAVSTEFPLLTDVINRDQVKLVTEKYSLDWPSW